MTFPPRDAGHQHKTLVTEFNEIFHHTTRQVHVLEKKLQNKFTQQTHFPAATFLQKYMCLHPLICDQALFFPCSLKGVRWLFLSWKKRTPDYSLLVLRLFAKGTPTFVRFWTHELGEIYSLTVVDRLTVVVFNHMNVFSFCTYVFVKTTQRARLWPQFQFHCPFFIISKRRKRCPCS